ncbi:GBF-interacting protein 1-like isoform X2 [Salvia hispanica]|uniref:GBF-interacting protein 1-like isoform X2 n=1 Tax=Salvia hispanica TaxID=49212 RepID=UPI002008F3C9|nr:GBF-interacting protein 1-like isoform X2 [Salvia hispanica]
MVSGAKIDGGAQVLSAGVRRTIQSIKEIVGNHSDADIYVVLKETNMDPNETTQKLLNQDPFHEVKRRKDRKKETPNPVQNSYTAVEPKKNNDVARMPAKYNTYPDRSSRRGGTSRNTASGGTREFRVVRDNRVNHTSVADSKPGINSSSRSPGVISSGSLKSSPSGSGHQEPAVFQHSSQSVKTADSQTRQTKDASSVGNDRKEMAGDKRFPIPSATSHVQTKANASQQQSTNLSSSSVVGVYSSSSDPVHVPSLHSRPAANVGAIRREVGVVGPRRQSSENSPKPSSSQGTSLPNAQSRQDGQSQESVQSFNAKSKNGHSNQNVASDSAVAGPPAGRSFSSNSYGSRSHQLIGHQKAHLPNKEWKPKASVKPSAKTVSPPADNPEHTKKEAAVLQDNISQLNLSESQNVIIAAHIRVSEADRRRLTFGSIGDGFEMSANSVGMAANAVEELSANPSGSVSVSATETSGDEPVTTKSLEMMDGSVRSSESNSPPSGDLSDRTEKKDSSSPQNFHDYADVGLMRGNSPSYTPESLQQHDTTELPSFSGYDPQMACDISYFRPVVDENVRGPSLTSSQEVLGSHATNVVPASTIAMVQQHQQQQQLQLQQQQQQQFGQMYPQLHVSHFANMMPYRQFLPPVYVPPMPGYSNSPTYPHPSNGSSYLLMPGNSSHGTPSGVKYGIQQFKPVPTGTPTVFGNFTSPAGYAINAPGVVASTAGHDDSSRIKYKDNLYVPNPQAETSEIWMNARDASGMQSSYYNIPAQSPHPAAYLTSHSGHASFNAAAAAAQPSHMQFQGMYHPSPQPPTIASPHHMGPAMGGNVGVGVAAQAPGAQVGAYQQPQLGHLNWTGNF